MEKVRLRRGVVQHPVGRDVRALGFRKLAVALPATWAAAAAIIVLIWGNFFTARSIQSVILIASTLGTPAAGARCQPHCARGHGSERNSLLNRRWSNRGLARAA